MVGCALISIHALRVEGDSTRMPARKLRQISIHALRVEGDITNVAGNRRAEEFLSTPSGWRATETLPPDKLEALFLSTPSGWRATRRRDVCRKNARNFYPRPPGGGRPLRFASRDKAKVFLSTPSGWRATFMDGTASLVGVFLSTPSGWRATSPGRRLAPRDQISIHALRVEGDAVYG